jgi:hypothetical protein
MNAPDSIAAAPLSAGATTRKRRRLAASLLAGWLAFWLTTTVAAACCGGVGGNVHIAAGESIAIGYRTTSQDPARGDHRELPCPTVKAQLAASAPTMAPASVPLAPQLYVASATPLPEPASAGPVGYGGTPPPLPVPFHQRTSRLLI